MRFLTTTDVDHLDAAAGDLAVPFGMNEEAFRLFYERTSRGLWAYLARITGDRHVADDLLQESYYRLLRAKVVHEDERHRKNYLFRIATNLANDRFRTRGSTPDASVEIHETHGADAHAAERAERAADLRRALGAMKPREREMLWLAYAEGSSHREIGDALGLKAASIRPMLFRARQKLAAILRAGGLEGGRRA